MPCGKVHGEFIKGDQFVGHLKKGATGQFAKIFCSVINMKLLSWELRLLVKGVT